MADYKQFHLFRGGIYVLYLHKDLVPHWKRAPGLLTRVDVNPMVVVWGVNTQQSIFVLIGRGWISVAGKLNHVSSGDSGVWGVNAVNAIYYREGITKDKLQGNSWTKIDGT